MSLYYDAAPLLVSASTSATSLKSKVFGSKDLKCPPKQVFALLSEASKWSPILKDVIEKSQLLQHERKLSPNLALLLVHDLLLAKRGISAPTSHPLRLMVEKHKARLGAEFKKARLRKGFAAVEDLRGHVDAGDAWIERNPGKAISNGHPEEKTVDTVRCHPRWVRVNTIKTSLKEQMETTFCDYKIEESLERLTKKSSNAAECALIHVDKHIPDLVAISPAKDLSKTRAYLNGLIVLQDKASCFPAYLLDPGSGDGEVVDACAAPGNKTTHLAAILHDRMKGSTAKIHACEKDLTRALTLKQMVQVAGADRYVHVREGQNFLKTQPHQAPWNSTTALLLDPSCSGSGIIDRDDKHRVVLPDKCLIETFSKHSSKKRKRESAVIAKPLIPGAPEEVSIIDHDISSEDLSNRLQGLATFQLKLLLHAFSFPAARKITYSTCSLHAEENEHIVIKALTSDTARLNGWRILRRNAQVKGMKDWEIRGDLQACQTAADGPDVTLNELAEACIRCEKGTREGTQGFFVAAFVRDYENGAKEGSPEVEWEGFGNEDDD